MSKPFQALIETKSKLLEPPKQLVEKIPAEKLFDVLQECIKLQTWKEDAIAELAEHKTTAWLMLSENERAIVRRLSDLPNHPLAKKYPIGSRIQKTYRDGSIITGTVCSYTGKWVRFMGDDGWAEFGCEPYLEVIQVVEQTVTDLFIPDENKPVDDIDLEVDEGL